MKPEMPSLNRRTLAQHMADQVDGLTIQMAAAAVEAMLDSISEALAAGSSVRLSRFGTFSLRYRTPRTTLHPRTREPIQIPAAYIPIFTPSTHLRDQIESALGS